MTPRSFVCEDCKVRVVTYVVTPHDLCMICIFLRSIKDEVEREKMRNYLNRGSALE
jgi:hypothetical protein